MITKTLNLDAAYQDLFQEINTKSEGALNITDLATFFGNITQIAALDPKYLRLPLDEPIFEIDANSRKIMVPAEFKSNGVSVQGDHLAEIIFFRIERFFDYKDLSTCDIEINWKMGQKEGKTTRFIKINDVELIDEVQSECVIFGWPINDIVTEKGGALTFAIEFSQTDEATGQISYRFNTLPVSVNIKDGLIVGENVEAIDLTDDIISNLINSPFADDQSAAVGNIIWLTGDGKGLVLGEKVGDEIILKNFSATVNLPTSIEDGEPQSLPISLYAQGFVDSGTEIIYLNAVPETLKVHQELEEVEDLNNLDNTLVYYLDALGLEVADIDNLSENVEVLFKVAPLVEGLKYYTKESESAYVLATEDDLAAWGKVETEEVHPVDLYVKVGKIEADKAGPYVIKAQGCKYNENHQIIGNGEVKTTDIVTVPEVTKPSAVNIAVSEKPLLPNTEEENNYYYEDNIENVVFLNNGVGQIIATPVVESSGAFKYNWFKEQLDENERLVFMPLVDGVPFVKDAPSNTLEVNSVGRYKVEVVNFLNGQKVMTTKKINGVDTEVEDAVESSIITVSNIAGAITNATAVQQVNGNWVPISVNTSVNYHSRGGSLSGSQAIIGVKDIVIENGGQEGTLEYQWYKKGYDSSDQEYWDPIDGATNSTYTVSGGVEGTFYLEIKNNCYGCVFTYKKLPPIIVNDRANDI